ncbi:PadR family transcriptional regulator [Candidatus Thorarchaeota archaeon]|nr:MAG: PadR family transcriptional regulator [Candidatus Thorarchaeota archaeon]
MTESDRSPLEPLPLVRALLLASIWHNPDSTGYDLMGIVSEFTDERVELKSGTIYAELRTLEREGLVQSIREETGRRRRSYRITKEGRENLMQLAEEIRFRTEHILGPLLSKVNSLKTDR